MSVREARDEILREHADLRGLIAEIEDLLERFARGEPEAATMLHASAGALYTRFIAHLVLEDRILVPSLQDAFGPESAEPVVRDHAEQRAFLGYLMGRLGSNASPAALIANDLRQFLTLLGSDMAEEERMLEETLDRVPSRGRS